MRGKKKAETVERDQKAASRHEGPGEKPQVESAEGGRGPVAEGQPEVHEPTVPEIVVEPPREALLEDRLLRLQADFDNFRKRTLREKEDLYRRANEDILLELLPVLDHLELAFRAAESDGKEHPVIQGFHLVAEQLRAALRKFGLEQVDASDAFDPNVHEAVQHLPSKEVEEGHVMVQLRSGYTLGSRLLRAAQVVVSSGPPEEVGAQAPEAEEATSEAK